MASRYSVEFSEGECAIKDATSKTPIARVHMTSHMLFPLNADDVGAAYIVRKGEELSDLWHKRYIYLNQRSLKTLVENQMVDGLPAITPIEPCESCSLGKQTRLELPKGQAMRATSLFELVHIDLVGPIHT